MEVSLTRRFTDDEHHDGLLVVRNLAVGQKDFLGLFVVLETRVATDIHDVRPRLEQSAQFRIVLADEQCLADVHGGYRKGNGQRTAAIDAQLLRLTDDHRLQQTPKGRQHTRAQNEQP